MARSPRKGTPPARLSVRAFAKRIGVSHTAIQKGIASGRLKASVGKDHGQSFIADADLAEKEWSAGATRLSPRAAQAATRDPAPQALSPAPPPPVVGEPVQPTEAAASGAPVPGQPPPAGMASSLADAQMRVQYQREVQLYLDNEKERGRLVDAAEARREAYRCARSVRDALLNIPDRIAGELAAESDVTRVHVRLDAEIRQALELLHEVLTRDE